MEGASDVVCRRLFSREHQLSPYFAAVAHSTFFAEGDETHMSSPPGGFINLDKGESKNMNKDQIPTSDSLNFDGRRC